MIHIFSVIAPLFLIILTGALLQRFRMIGDNWQTVLNEFALKIGFPALIFTSLTKAPFSLTEQAPLITINSLFIVLLFFLAYILGKILKLDDRMRRTLFITLVFGNIAYLGIPVLTQVSGPQILPTASLIVAIYLFWNFTVGIAFLDITQRQNRRNVLMDVAQNLFRNPLLISVILGLAVAAADIRLPAMIMTPLHMITASVTPIVLTVIGLFIGQSAIGNLADWRPVLWLSCFILVLKPALLYFGLGLSGLSQPDLHPSVIDAAMPLAITPFALADRYDMDKEFIARGIVLSTILSIATLPFWISLV